MYIITKFIFYIIISFYSYKYFRNIRKPMIINEYKQKLGIGDDKNENIKRISIKIDILSVLVGVTTFTLCISNSLIIVIVLSSLLLISLILNK
ncbi:MAG: hypothetical protein RRZ84_08735 [Romboutsia sp.]